MSKSLAAWFPRWAVFIIGALLLAMRPPVAVLAHEEVVGGGVFNYSQVLSSGGHQYHVDLMYSPSLPTAGEPANIGIGLKRLLPVPDPLLGSEIPLTTPPTLQLVDHASGRVVVESLPVISEGVAGDFEVMAYPFPRSGSFLLRLIIASDTGESLTTEVPITVKANAAGFFRFLVNLAVAILILGLTGMQLWKVRARGGELAQMIRPAAIGFASLVLVVLAMDRFILGAVLDLRRPTATAPAEESVTTNEDGSYVIPAAVQEQLGLRLADAREMALGQTVTAFGTVEARPDLTAAPQAQLWGRIEWSNGPLAVGDRVHKGQELVKVILELNALERGTMEEKDLDIKGAKKLAEERRNAARLEYDRIKALRARNPEYEPDEAWAKQSFDQAEADYREIVRQEVQYQAVMKFRDPRSTVVASPIDGVIASVNFVPGELNATDQYRQLFTIVDLSRVWVRAEVLIADVVRIKDGDTVRVFPPGRPDRPVAGRVRWIGDTINAVDRTVPVLVDVANESGAFALGSFARLEFDQSRKGLAVPVEAVVDEGTSRWVYVARADDTFMPVKVEMGVRQGGWWQVNSGLVEGDRVIAEGAALLGSMPHPDGAVTQVLPGQSPASHAHGSGEPHQH